MYTEELYLKILRKELRSEIRRYFSEEKCSESIILNVLNDAESIIKDQTPLLDKVTRLCQNLSDSKWP